MIRTSYDLEAYLARIAELHPRIRKFARGPFDRYLDLSAKRMEWPVLWMEDPEIDTRHDNTTYNFNLMLLQRSKEDNWEDQNLQMANIEDIFTEVIQKLEDDAEDGLFNINQDRKLVPISGITHSHDVGYRVMLNIDSNIEICPDLPSALNGEIFIPRASVHIEDGFMEIQSGNDYSYNVGIYNLDHGLIEVYSDNPLRIDISSLDDFFYVHLTYFVEDEEISITNLVHKNGSYFPLIHEQIIE